MGGLYRGCVKKLRLCLSNINNYYGFFLTYIVAYLLSCKLLFDCFILLLRLTVRMLCDFSASTSLIC